ncbi:MAG: pectinesterase family protein [Polyangiales bacterium]
MNPDTRLKLTFAGPPTLRNAGKITIRDASNDSVVDELDMSIPPGPRNTRTPAPYDTFKYSSVPDTVFTVDNPDTDPSHVYQTNYVGDSNDSSARHFFPVLLDGDTATIFPHNGRLAYGKTYYVEIDASVFGAAVTSGKASWSFTTKQAGPSADATQLVVSADGSGDFSSVQGAIDAIADDHAQRREIYVRSGIYEEIIALRNKKHLTLRGESRSDTIVRYANNGVFNSVGRYEFTVSGADDVALVNFTIQSVGKDETPAQAEALYVKGDKVQTHRLTMLGSGDALQIQASTRLFLSQSSVRGYGDNFLSYGAAYFKRCELISTYGPHGWPRNPETNHGDVFVESTFRLEGEGTSGDGHCALARSPTSGVSFPYAEFVLINCKLQGITPEGWGAVGPDTTNVHFWEYNSVNLTDGQPVDVSKRVAWSRQLTMDRDAETIANYSDPTFVLGGWTPELAPIVLTQLPGTLAIPDGGGAELVVDAVAEPEPEYQWLKDGQPLPGETRATLWLEAATAADSGSYSVSVTNRAGTAESGKINVAVGTGAPPPTAGTGALGGAGASDPGASGASATGAGGAGAANGVAGDGPGSASAAGAGVAGAPTASQPGGAQAGANAGLAGGATRPSPAGTAAPPAAAAGTHAATVGAPDKTNEGGGRGCSALAAQGGTRWPWLLGLPLAARWTRRRRLR